MLISTSPMAFNLEVSLPSHFLCIRGKVLKYKLAAAQASDCCISCLSCRYVGELISDSEADVREEDSYLFDLDNKVVF